MFLAFEDENEHKKQFVSAWIQKESKNDISHARKTGVTRLRTMQSNFVTSNFLGAHQRNQRQVLVRLAPFCIQSTTEKSHPNFLDVEGDHPLLLIPSPPNPIFSPPTPRGIAFRYNYPLFRGQLYSRGVLLLFSP